MYVGLDISTSCIGASLLDEFGKVIKLDYLELKEEKSFFKKVDMFSKFLLEFLNFNSSLDLIQYYKNENYEEIYFYVEEPLQAFKSNASMAQTISLLQRYNACCTYVIYQLFMREPILLNATNARKTLGISVPRKTANGLKTDTKKFVWDFIKNKNVIPDFYWQFKKTGNPKNFCYDMCDAYVIAFSGFLKQNGG